MKVKILYFARLREMLNVESEVYELTGEKVSIFQLRDLLQLRGKIWHDQLSEHSTVRIALNQEIVDGEELLKEGDEVAFFPPVTGG